MMSYLLEAAERHKGSKSESEEVLGGTDHVWKNKMYPAKD